MLLMNLYLKIQVAKMHETQGAIRRGTSTGQKRGTGRQGRRREGARGGRGGEESERERERAEEPKGHVTQRTAEVRLPIQLWHLPNYVCCDILTSYFQCNEKGIIHKQNKNILFSI